MPSAPEINRESIVSKGRRGGRRPGAGRKRGIPDRATPFQKEGLEGRARLYTDQALKALIDVATKGESEAARVTAANALLDRGYGRPRQAVEIAHVAPDDLPNLSDDDLAAIAAGRAPK